MLGYNPEISKTRTERQKIKTTSKESQEFD